jgi:hypothetical protein
MVLVRGARSNKNKQWVLFTILALLLATAGGLMGLKIYFLFLSKNVFQTSFNIILIEM